MAASRTSKVSVVLCTYNGERFLREQLESIARQTRLPDELVIHDDASTDNTVSILRTASFNFPVKVTIHDRNLGSTQAFQRAIADASGDLIALCDQDDVWEPHKIATLEAAFQANVRLVFSDARLIDESGADLHDHLWYRIGLRGALLREFASDPIRVLGRGKNVVTGATTALRAELRKQLLPIPSGWVHDAWIAVLAALVGEVRMVKEPLIRYRLHSNQQLGLTPETSTFDRDPETFMRLARMFDDVIDRAREFADPRRLRWVEESASHARIRAELPARRTRRVTVIRRELFAGRYHRFSNGFASVLKDLLIK